MRTHPSDLGDGLDAGVFGGHKKGPWKNGLKYSRERIFAFGITFGPIPDDWYAVGAAAIVMGYPVYWPVQYATLGRDLPPAIQLGNHAQNEPTARRTTYLAN